MRTVWSRTDSRYNGDSAMPSSLSVVVPTHSTREITLRCLASVLRSARDLEVIVVDDASTDGTAEALAEKFPQIRVLANPKRSGFSRTSNRGLTEARGDILLLLNSDTEISSRAVAAVRAAFDRKPRLGVAGARLIYPDGAPQWSGGREPTPMWLFGQASGLPALLGRIPGYRLIKPPGGTAGSKVDWVSGAAMAIRRDVWNEVGPLDEDYGFYCQDLHFCAAARDAGWRVEVVPSFEVIHHHGATITATAGSAAPYHPEFMWADLVRFAGWREGPDAARKAASALASGARLRLLARRLYGAFLGSLRPATWERDTRAFEAGLAVLKDLEL